MNVPLILEPGQLLARVAERTPPGLRKNVVVIGSIASVWAFRDVRGTGSVATKDIDLLLQPAVDAVATAESLGAELLKEGWEPQYPNAVQPGTTDTLDDDLPALRLTPPDEPTPWFVELLGEPYPDQDERRSWRRIRTEAGDFGLPSFRYMRVAVHDAQQTEFGLRIARPSNMALAHLLEHSDPDRTPISSLTDRPPRFTKDVGRAIALWWLAGAQSPLADARWLEQWCQTLCEIYPDRPGEMREAARAGLGNVKNYLAGSHRLALNSVLGGHNVSLDAFKVAYDSLMRLVERLSLP
ncbi:hypothetical protein LY625_00845 [Lysobacter sp. GX 14042]|uniref:hypothetical protein n=1 Tax=Lysobacter sp. GX 14042 TaxID=2907155 RepID=UPI001F3F8C6B|nr:hypothetical protein [Lysobacter sp. GX 14042]MCE7031185.1 hypothetical protein [Lysobacter sp. GX 14042]